MRNAIQQMGFGCVGLSAQPFLHQAIHLLETAFEEGIRHFDTAPLYGQGYSEKILGKFLKGKKREQITVTTKFGLGGKQPSVPAVLALPLHYARKKMRGTVHQNTNASGEISVQPFRKIGVDVVRYSFEKSISNLNVSYIDYLMLHEGVPDFLDPDALHYLLSLKQEGRVRYLGLAAGSINYRSLSEPDIKEWDVLQYEFNPHGGFTEISNRFPFKQHMLHSCLKNINDRTITDIPADKKAGYLLAECMKLNPGGKVLFASSSAKHIRTNIRSAISFLHHP